MAAPVASLSFPPCRRGAYTARWLPDGDSAFAAMVALIDGASTTVALEFYLVRGGEPALSVRAALVRAAGRGVQVSVLLDAFGSEGLAADFFAPLAAVGGAIRRFSPSRRLRLACRDHRKLLVCDSRCALVGGINIGPEYLGDGVRRGWFDLALQIEGPIAARLAASFAAMFALAPMNAAAVGAFRRRRAAVVAPVPTPADDGTAGVSLLLSGPGWPAGRLSHALRADLARAREMRCIAGYFLPPARIRRALRRCVRRGGVAQMLLAGRSDVAVARYAAEHLFGRMLAAGAQLYEYQPQILHAKLIILDHTVYVGSCNLDRRSLNINFELLLRLEWPELAEQARALFATALTHSAPVPAASWGSRRHWWERWRSRAAYWLLTRIDPLLARRGLRTLG